MSLKPDRVSLTASKLFSQALNLMWSESTSTWRWPHVTFIIATLFSRQGHPSHFFPYGHLRSKILNYFLRGIWYKRKFNFDPITVKFGNHDLMTHFYESLCYESQVLVILMSHNFFLLEIFNFFFSDFVFSFIQGGAHNEILDFNWSRQKAQRKKNKMRGRFEERFEWEKTHFSLLRHIQKRNSKK